MKFALRFPIRIKIMIALLFAITASVSFITFMMAGYFHADKQAYVRDWVSRAAVTTADDSDMVLRSYVQRLQSFARILLTDGLPREEKRRAMQSFFEDLPELIALTLYADGKPVDTARDKLALQEAGIDAASWNDHLEEHRPPFERLIEGEVHVRNATFVESLPAMTLDFAGHKLGEGPPVIVSALLRPDQLLRMASRFGVFEMLIVDADGVLLAHPDEARVARREPVELHEAARSVGAANQVGRTVEFERDGELLLGGFATVPTGDLTVAAYIPESVAYLASRDLQQRLLWMALIVLVLCAVAGRLWARRVTRPVERLSRATREIAKGTFDIRVDVESRDEIGALAGSFNQMASGLKERDEALEEAQTQLIQSEKLAAFGQLGAGIAHEVKNPLAGILGCAQLSLMTEEEGTTAHRNLKIIERETERCKTIIENLLKFARQEKTELVPTDVNQVVRDSAAIVQHQMEMNEVTLTVELQEAQPPVQGNANQLQQVLMNLMINAQQAMEGRPGEIVIGTEGAGDDAVQIFVNDNGPGMPDHVQRKIFEPFFTTKPTGQGTGLGLSVSYGIIQEHHGEIVVESTPGEGTTFRILLPALKGVKVETPVFA